MKTYTLSTLILLALALLAPMSTARPFTIPAMERSDEALKICKRARQTGGLPSQKCVCQLLFKRKIRTQKTRRSKKVCLKFFEKKRRILALKNACEEYMVFPKVVDVTRLAKDMNRYLRVCKPDVGKLLFPQCMIFRALFKRRCILVMGR